MKEELTIRVAKPEDAKGLLEIYAPYVEKTAITFEYGVPSEKEFAGRIRHILTKYPYLVLEENGELLGYVYAGTFNERSAYDWAVETTIYIREDQKKRGLGKKMYTALEQVLKKQNITNLNACIGVPEVRMNILTATAWIFIIIWDTGWWENFISAGISLIPGIIWCGWRK